MRQVCLAVFALTLAFTTSCSRGPSTEVTVFAAASLQNVVEELGAAFHDRHPEATFVYNFAGSNVLARQIGASPKADLFLSANRASMERLMEQGQVAGEPKKFASNSLVAIANASVEAEVKEFKDFVTFPFEHLALGDPDAVPAGIYAREWLSSKSFMGKTLWELAESRTVPRPDVRSVLHLVEAEPDTIGIVYKTDAATSDKVRVIYEVPAEDGPDIGYYAASIEGAPNPEVAKDFLSFLMDDGPTILQKNGFGRP